jgi:hypothetical protein
MKAPRRLGAFLFHRGDAEDAEKDSPQRHRVGEKREIAVCSVQRRVGIIQSLERSEFNAALKAWGSDLPLLCVSVVRVI